MFSDQSFYPGFSDESFLMTSFINKNGEGDIRADGSYNLFQVSELGSVMLEITGVFDGGILAVEKAGEPSGEYTAYIKDGADVSFTTPSNPVYLVGGYWFRLTLSGSTYPRIHVRAVGPYVSGHPESGEVA